MNNSTFEQFLRPREDLSFVKSSVSKYISVEEFFRVEHKQVGAGLHAVEYRWYWILLPHIATVEEKSFIPLYKLEKSQSGHSSWQQARDEIAGLIEKYIPDFDRSVKQTRKTQYSLCCKGEYTGIMLKKFKQWEVLFPYDILCELPVCRKTRHLFLNDIYDYVSKNLPALYFKNTNLYAVEREKMLEASKSYNYKLWWMWFVNPEINLEEIFFD